MRSSSSPEPSDEGPLDLGAAGEQGAQAKAAFHLRMRARGVRDLRVLRALELVPREAFLPARYGHLAPRDLAVPIGCGQTSPEPSLIARAVEALGPHPAHRVLEVGSGSGYVTAILALLAADVVGIERFQGLAAAARARLGAMASNAVVSFGDGLALAPALGPFDRIIVHGVLPRETTALDALLAPAGALVCVRHLRDGTQAVVRIERVDGEARETAVCPCRLAPMLNGVAAIL